MGETNHSGELGTQATGRRGQRAGMLSRSWLRFVLIMVLTIATERRARQLASRPSGAPRTGTPAWVRSWHRTDLTACPLIGRYRG
jgi:hypothetical protein